MPVDVVDLTFQGVWVTPSTALVGTGCWHAHRRGHRPFEDVRSLTPRVAHSTTTNEVEWLVFHTATIPHYQLRDMTFDWRKATPY